MIKNRNSKVNVTLAITLWLIASHYVAHHGFNLGPILSHFGYHLHSDDLTRLDQSQREMIEQRFKSRKASLRLAYPVLLFLAEKDTIRNTVWHQNRNLCKSNIIYIRVFRIRGFSKLVFLI